MSARLIQDSASLESLVAAVADEFLQRQRQGERPDVEEYCTRHPEAAALLRKVLASLEVLADISGSRTTAFAAQGELALGLPPAA